MPSAGTGHGANGSSRRRVKQPCDTVRRRSRENAPLREVLKKAGVPQGGERRTKALASHVVAAAQEGYEVVFSLAELDPAFIDNEILLADTANGKPLVGTQGRFRLVVPKDKPGARSVRMLTKVEVVQLKK